LVTGVQTCALPILSVHPPLRAGAAGDVESGIDAQPAGYVRLRARAGVFGAGVSAHRCRAHEDVEARRGPRRAAAVTAGRELPAVTHGGRRPGAGPPSRTSAVQAGPWLRPQLT